MSLNNLSIKSAACLLLSVFTFLNAHAASYVFGGWTHFQGILVNQSCSMLVHAEDVRLVAFSHKFKIYPTSFTECTKDVYQNINVVVSDGEQYEGGRLDLIKTKAITQEYENSVHFEKDNSQNEAVIYFDSDYKRLNHQTPNIMLMVFYP
ncbi:hypothetical protein ACG9XW_04515 [Acinetobacter guillouiae]|uniref:hypothetical protein n=1 Tax=Acinetobacter guillouiae TaxID=106649 RepID=UPI003AF7AC84